MEISTSILSVKKENAVKTFYNIEEAKTDYFHIDVMDGKFVKENTLKFMNESLQTLNHITNTPLDIHLMVEEPAIFIEKYLSFNPLIITVHVESENYKEAIELIKNAGLKAGISIKPDTPVGSIKFLLPYISLILVMTVEPGLGGQQLIPKTIDKIKELYKYREENNLDYFIEADGGINLDTINLVKGAGADIAVCGTAIVNSNNIKETIKELKKWAWKKNRDKIAAMWTGF